MFKEYQIYPTNFIKLINWVTIEGNKAICKKGEKGHMLVQGIDGKKFIVAFKKEAKGEVVSRSEVEGFFDKKATQTINSSFISKIKDDLSEFNETLFEDIEKHIVDNKLDRKQARVYEKEILEEKANELASKDKTIKAGSVIRVALSAGDKIPKVTMEEEEFQIIDSVSILVDKSNEPTGYGMYYVSQNQYSIPLVLSLSDDDKWLFFVNNSIVDRGQMNEILRHSIRTVEETNGFFIYIFTSTIGRNESALIPAELKTMINTINDSVKAKASSKFNSTVSELITYISQSEDNFKNFVKYYVVKLPTRLSFEEVLQSEGNLLARTPEALLNTVFRKYAENLEDNINEINTTLNNIIKDSKKLYGYYNIMSTPGVETSNTYGFLPQNLRLKDKLFVSIEQYGNLLTKVSKAFYEKYGSGGQKVQGKGIKEKTYQSSSSSSKEDFDIDSVF